MKKFTIFLTLLLCATAILAQSPEKFTYQAVVRNASNALVSNAPVGVRVSILQGGINGNLAYMETQTAVTNANGLMTLQIGGGNVLQGVFADIDWANGPYFLKTEIDPNGGDNYTITSVQQMLSVPYALYAKEAGNAFSGDYNDLTNQPLIPTVPTDVSAFNNDAGYLTSYTEQQILTITNDTIFLTGGSFVKLPSGFDGDYNSLTNKPELFSGDYNDLTNQPVIPTVPTNISAFTNDAGYLTGYTETDPQFNAWDKDYNDLINTPTIPTVPTNVSDFTNDAGYLTSFTEQQVLSISHDTLFLTGGSFVKLPAGFDGDYNSLTNKPELFSGDYNDLTNQPIIPTVPTNVSAFTNDAGYLTGYTETDPQFNAWDKDYNDLINTPTIPTVPTNVSDFTNDAGYLTSFTEQQVLSISHDTLFLTGGSFVKLPAGFDGDYNSLTNKPELFSGDYNDLTNQPIIPTVPTNVSAFTNDAGYLTGYTETDPQFNAWDKDYNDLTNTPTIPTVPTNVSAFTNDAGYLTSFTEQQVLSISHDTLFLTGGSFVKLPTGFDGDYNSLTNKPELFSGDYNDLTNQPVIPVVPINVSAFTNDAGYLTGYTETDPQFNAWDKDYNDLINTPTIPTVPTNVSAFTNDAGYITEASCNGVNICEMFNGLEALQSQVDSLQQSFLLPETHALPPTVKTAAVSNITESSAICGGNVISDGGSVVSAKGVCWNTTGTPTISDNHTIDGGGMGAFLSDLQILTRDTTYYVRAYATNSAGTSYGSQMSFTFPEYQLWSGTGLNPNDALPCQGAVMVADSWGNVYNTMQIGNQCWMRENLRNVSGNEHFYWPDVLQACPTGWHIPNMEDWWILGNYITPSFVVNFGDGAFWTSTTQPFEDSDGNQYTLIQYPNVQSNTVAISWGHREVSDAADLLSVRCIRDVSNFTVQENSLPPTVTTAEMADIVAVSATSAPPATCGGNVTSDGGSVVSAKGICWNTTGNPTLSDNHTIDGGGTGVFESNMHGLVVGNTYYVRAYATNIVGTSYGSQVSFTVKVYQSWDGTGRNPNDALPCQGLATVSDHEGNVYNTVQIGNQCWTKENMRCTTSPSTGTTILEYPAGNMSYTGKKAYYVNGSADNTAVYGLLYNWNAAVDTFDVAFGETSTGSLNNSFGVTFSGHRRGICPEGWHVPNNTERSQLYDYVSSQSEYTCGGVSSNIAKALASNACEWYLGADTCFVGNDPSTNNATGFSAVLAGCYRGYYSDFERYVLFWGTTQRDNYRVYDFWTGSDYPSLYYCSENRKAYGASVRCLRD